VTAKGRGYALPGGGTLLGLGLACASSERSVTLSSGTAVIFYTDGLIEYDRDIFTGEARLIETLEGLAHDGAISGVALHERILSRGARDDCATLVITSSPHPARPVERYTVSAVPTSARLLRDAVRNYADRAGITGDQQFSAVVASGEAIANAIEHGEQEAGTAMTVAVSADEGRLRIDVESRGHWRSTSSENRGRGVSIMRAYASNLELTSTSERTRVSLTFQPGTFTP
jgi:anti-sigma regulatory factor (Ser/Thr protein kinase)